MEENKCFTHLGNHLDIQQILREAQDRWLRPAEICEILSKYKQFRIAPEPPHLPPSGSLFLFDRKVLRYFRKDGHSWRKKKDGKTVKEAHEKLKSGSIDVLHCYYAHGEDNEYLQRRTYWMLEKELSHIVLVHYREVKDGRANLNRAKENKEAIAHTETNISVSSNFNPTSYQMATPTDTRSMNSAQESGYEDADSAQNNQSSSRFHSFLEVPQPAMDKIDASPSDPCAPESFSNFPQMDLTSLLRANKAKESNGTGLNAFDLPLLEDVLVNLTPGFGSMTSEALISLQADALGQNMPKELDGTMRQFLANCFGRSKEIGYNLPINAKLQTVEGGSLSTWNMDEKLRPDFMGDLTSRFHNTELGSGNVASTLELFVAQGNYPHVQGDLQRQHSDAEQSKILQPKTINASAGKQLLLDSSTEEGLKKLDSFNRWMSKELGDVDERHVQSSSGVQWDTIESENGFDDSGTSSQAHLDTYMLGPSLSQDQLFSIIDFSPNWANVCSEVKVLITGRFLKNQQEVENCKWSCMFGEIEVPAEVIAEGVLRCHTPLHKAGRVPFYVTCSNRIACSQIYEFEYRVSHVKDVDMTENLRSTITENLRMRFGKLLCQSSTYRSKYDTGSLGDISHKSSKIHYLLKEDADDWDQMLNHTSEGRFSSEKVQEWLVQKLLKENLLGWLLQKVGEGGKGPSVLDDNGQGVLHFAAALGYDWALEPTIVADVNVNFRDINGWTALHWAAFCGRECTVVCLIHLGAAPGALTDPTPTHPTGRTPADLASANGHKGIAGYLAELALSSHISSLNLDKEGDAVVNSGAKAVEMLPEQSETPVVENLAHGLSLKDPLAAVRNATQAVARIHQVFRIESFQRKQLKQFDDDKFGMSDEQALSLIEIKPQKAGKPDEPVHSAVVRIQNKFRSWKGRRDFLITRQRIVKIQAHVRGHQVRKSYRKIVWSVGILEKVILRWKRKRSGLRGFKSEALTEGPSMHASSQKDDDYDFFREGRKQTEERLQIALARVKSMLQHPEARDQYQRLLNAAAEMQETKVVNDQANNSEVTTEFNDLIDIELPDDDTLMAKAC